MSIEKYGALLHAPWERGNATDEISALWAEDSNVFIIYAPPQLRDLLIEMQNELHAKVDEIRKAKHKLHQLEIESSAVFSDI